MERVAFLLQSTGERLGCLLNPESLLVQRTAGLKACRSLAGPFTGAGLTDDPLLFVGGGTTELTLDLLFDVAVAGSTIQTEDVRDLTRPLWQLTERSEVAGERLLPPIVRFVWGKAWNIPGVVAAVAERLERFTPGGAPRRSWMRLRMLRVSELEGAAVNAPRAAALPPPGAGPIAPEDLPVHQVLGAGPAGGERATGQRLDELAQLYYGDSSLWRLIARENGIQDPMAVGGGAVLRIPQRGTP
jgi:hypothetical protein